MTEKRFTTMWKPETTFSRFWIARENWERKLNANDVVDLLNELHEENIKLRTLNYVNKEAVRLNNIKTVKIGREDVDCSNINWELLYELYNKMIDFYYDESGDLE